MESVMGLELNHPIISMLWGHRGRSKIMIKIQDSDIQQKCLLFTKSKEYFIE